jgi:hypothetical protein
LACIIYFENWVKHLGESSLKVGHKVLSFMSSAKLCIKVLDMLILINWNLTIQYECMTS